jgi:hypothetical protein
MVEPRRVEPVDEHAQGELADADFLQHSGRIEPVERSGRV